MMDKMTFNSIGELGKYLSSLEDDETVYDVVFDGISLLPGLEDLFKVITRKINLEFTNCADTKYPVIKNLRNKGNIISIVLPDTITAIEGGIKSNDGAFSSFSSLKSIKLPGVKTLGRFAFAYCYNLEEIDLPKVNAIAAYAIMQCTNLVKINPPLAKRIGRSAFLYDKKLKTLDLPKVETIEDVAFFPCEAIEKIELPSIKKLGERVFDACTSLTEVTLGKNLILEEFHKNIFSRCDNLKIINVSKEHEVYFKNNFKEIKIETY